MLPIFFDLFDGEAISLFFEATIYELLEIHLQKLGDLDDLLFGDPYIPTLSSTTSPITAMARLGIEGEFKALFGD